MLGTFAVYYREARAPTTLERSWVGRATHLAAIAICRDRAERAVRQADARYRQIVDTAYEGVWLIDADARTLLVNERTAKLLGFEADELVGRKIVDFMDEPSRQAAEGSFIQRVRTVSDQHQFRFRRRDGSYFWALISGSPIRDEQGPRGGRAVHGQRHHRAEGDRAGPAPERGGVPGGVRERGHRHGPGRPRTASCCGPTPRCSGSWATASPSWPSATSRNFTHPDDVQSDHDLYERMTSGAADSYQDERRYLRKDGAVVWGRLTATVVRPAKGKPMLAIGMIENVSERRRMEEAVRSSERLRALIYDSVTDVLFYLGVEADNRYRFLSVNQAFLKATGLREDQVVHRLVDEVIPEPARTMVLGHYARAIHERRTISWDETSHYPGGGQIRRGVDHAAVRWRRQVHQPGRHRSRRDRTAEGGGTAGGAGGDAGPGQGRHHRA